MITPVTAPPLSAEWLLALLSAAARLRTTGRRQVREQVGEWLASGELAPVYVLDELGAAGQSAALAEFYDGGFDGAPEVFARAQALNARADALAAAHV